MGTSHPGDGPDISNEQWIHQRAQDLCDMAKQMGVVLEVTLVPSLPLAMGSYEMGVSTRPARPRPSDMGIAGKIIIHNNGGVTITAPHVEIKGTLK